MSSVSDLIAGALRLLGVVDANAPIDANDAATGLEALNGLIGSLSLEELLVYTVAKEEFTLTGGQASYTMGTGGNFNTSRPVRIESAKYKVGDQEYDLHVMTDQEWQSVELRTLGGFPEYLHVSGEFPLQTLTLWPVPSASDKLLLFSWKPLTSFSSVTDVLSLPPGYDRMLRYCLAIEIAPEYGVEPSGAIIANARDAKAAIKRANAQPLYLACDPALMPRQSGYSRSDFLGGK